MSNASIQPPHADHPGWTAEECPARLTIVPRPYATSGPGFACGVTGEHCIPGEKCERLRREWAEIQKGQ